MKKIIISMLLVICIVGLVGIATQIPTHINSNQITNENSSQNNQFLIISSELRSSEKINQVEIIEVRRIDSGFVSIQDSSIRYTQNDIQEVSHDRGILVESRGEVRIY